MKFYLGQNGNIPSENEFFESQLCNHHFDRALRFGRRQNENRRNIVKLKKQLAAKPLIPYFQLHHPSLN